MLKIFGYFETPEKLYQMMVFSPILTKPPTVVHGCHKNNKILTACFSYTIIQKSSLQVTRKTIQKHYLRKTHMHTDTLTLVYVLSIHLFIPQLGPATREGGEEEQTMKAASHARNIWKRRSIDEQGIQYN